MRGGRIDCGCDRVRLTGRRAAWRFEPGGLSVSRLTPDRGGAMAAGGATGAGVAKEIGGATVREVRAGSAGLGDNMRGTLRAGPSASSTLRSTVTAGPWSEDRRGVCASAWRPANTDSATRIIAPTNKSAGTANRIPRLRHSAMTFLLVPPGEGRAGARQAPDNTVGDMQPQQIWVPRGLLQPLEVEEFQSVGDAPAADSPSRSIRSTGAWR